MLDGHGDLAALKMPSGRTAMIERMSALMQGAAKSAPPGAAAPIMSAEELAAEDLRQRHGESALLIEARQTEDGRGQILAVLDADPATLAREAKRLASQGEAEAPAIVVIDHATWSLLQRLQAGGVIQFVGTSPRRLHHSAALTDVPVARLAAARAAELRALAERQLAKARVLAAGGFPEELPALITEAIGHAAAARLTVLGELAADAKSATPANVHDLVARQELPPEASAILYQLSAGPTPSAGEAEQLLAATAGIISASAPPGPTTRGSS